MKIESILATTGATTAAAATAATPLATTGPAALAGQVGAAPGPKGSAAGAAAASSGDSTHGVKYVADEFERMLLVQMLRSSKVCGDEKGHAGMLVDALAEGVMKGGGMGLSQALVRSLEQSLAARQGASTAAAGENVSPSAAAAGGNVSPSAATAGGNVSPSAAGGEKLSAPAAEAEKKIEPSSRP